MEEANFFDRQRLLADFEEDEELIEFQDLIETIREFETPAREIAGWLKSAICRRAEAFDEQKGKIDPRRVEINDSDMALLKDYNSRSISRDKERERIREERKKNYGKEC